MDILLGSLAWTMGAACLLAAAPRLARLWLPESPDLPASLSERFLRAALVLTALSVLSTGLAAVAGLLLDAALLRGTTLLALALATLGAALAWGPKPGKSAKHPAADDSSEPDSMAPASQASTKGASTARRTHEVLGGHRLPLGLALALVMVDTVLALPVPPSSWDAMTYHLFLPARWLQEGRWLHVPTVFADNHAAYAPQNGALFHAWHMALSKRDALTTATQGPLILFAGLALYRTALLLGIRRTAAAWVAPLAVALVPVRRWGYTANVDLFMAAFFVGATYWALHLWRRGRPIGLDEPGAATRARAPTRAETAGLASGRAAALAAGLTAGTKTVGLALALGPLALVGGLLIARRQWRELARAGLLALVGGGTWYAAAALRYGNPLFPLDFSFGPLHFAGAYRSAALRSSFLNVDLAAWLGTVDRTLGRPTWMLALVAALCLSFGGLLVARHRRRPVFWLATLGLGVAALGWAWFCFAVQPYNNQTRFLVPGLWLALLGIPLALDQWSSPAPAVGASEPAPGRADGPSVAAAKAGLVGLALLALLLARAPESVGFVARLRRLGEAGVEPLPWALAAGLGALVSLALVLRSGHPGSPTFSMAASPGLSAAVSGKRESGIQTVGLLAPGVLAPGILAPGILAIGVLAIGVFAIGASSAASDRARPYFLAHADFRVHAPGYMPFTDPALAPANIAYSGANIPYALVGPGWRHRVVYVDTHGETGDDFHAHWLRDPRLYDTHKPGIYRAPDEASSSSTTAGAPNGTKAGADAWLRRLDELEIDIVALFAPLPVEIPEHWAFDGRFLVERRYVREHPERFSPLVRSPTAELYQVLPPANRAGLPQPEPPATPPASLPP